jgi:hypothetical protein
VIQDFWGNAIFSVIPTLLIGLIFWFVMRSILRADRPVTDLLTAVIFNLQGIRPGWLGGAFDANSDLTILTETELLTLGLCPYVQAN